MDSRYEFLCTGFVIFECLEQVHVSSTNHIICFDFLNMEKSQNRLLDLSKKHEPVVMGKTHKTCTLY